MTIHRSRHALALIVCLALCAAACGSDDAKTASNSSGGSTPPTAAGTDSSPAAATTVAGTAAANDSAAAAEAAALKAAGGNKIGGSVSILGVLGGDELKAFEGVLAPFEKATGIDVKYEGTRDIAATLQTRIDGGNPPDLATNPGVGQMLALAKSGDLVDLSDVIPSDELGQYDKALLDGVTVDGRLSAIYTAVNLEGLIWYDPKTYTGPTKPASFDELEQWAKGVADKGTTPWCIGLESGAASGWPGVVWITELMLRSAGPDAYTKWWQGKLPWTSPEVRHAFDVFGTIATDGKMVNGGPTAVLATAFANGGDAMFSDPPHCYLHQQASFYGGIATANFPNLAPVTDVNDFPFPDVNPAFPGLRQVSGEVMGMFNDTPQARALVAYFASAEAQTLLAQTGIWLSPNTKVPIDSYPTQFAQQAATIVQGADGIYYDGSSLMPTAMNAAFTSAILDYVAKPGSIDDILAGLDKVQASAYGS